VLLVFLAGLLSASSHGAFVVTSKTPGLAAVGTILGDGQRRSGSCVHKRPLALRMNGGSSARESRTLSKNECEDPICPHGAVKPCDWVIHRAANPLTCSPPSPR